MPGPRRIVLLGTLVGGLLPALAGCGPDPGEAGGRAEARGQEPAAAESARRRAFYPLEIVRGTRIRERVLIGAGGVVRGPVGGPLSTLVFSRPAWAQDLSYFVRTYGPFRAELADGELVFRGHGRVKPNAVERRMIVEWARQVAAEAARGRGAAAYALVLGWHRGATPGTCEDLAIYRTGEVRASACEWGGEQRGRLRPGALGPLYDWFDRLRPVQHFGPLPDAGAPGPVRLVFAGRGEQAASAAEIAEIGRFASAVFRELEARQESAPAPAERFLLPPPPAVAPALGPALEGVPDTPPPPDGEERP
jgi:hypothetical protein